MERRVTFLLGSGRCGSTLAQRIINACPQAIIWGEHGGFLTPVANGYFQILDNKNLQREIYQHPGRYSPDKIIANREEIYQSDISWMNDLDRASIKQHFKNLVESMFSDRLPDTVSCWGFKEILYGINDRDRSIDLLLELFPRSRNIIIIRHPIDTLVSMLTAWNPHLVDRSGAGDKQALTEVNRLVNLRAKNWASQNQKLLEYLDKFPENFMLLKYEDFQDKFQDTILPYLGINTPLEIARIFAKKVWETKNSDRSSISKGIINSQTATLEQIVGKVAAQINYKIA